MAARLTYNGLPIDFLVFFFNFAENGSRKILVYTAAMADVKPPKVENPPPPPYSEMQYPPPDQYPASAPPPQGPQQYPVQQYPQTQYPTAAVGAQPPPAPGYYAPAPGEL